MGRVKTTIEIPDNLFREAKALAAKQGLTLKALVTNSLRQTLATRKTALPDQPWMKFYGCMKDIPADELAALSKRIEQECERVDDKDWS